MSSFERSTIPWQFIITHPTKFKGNLLNSLWGVRKNLWKIWGKNARIPKLANFLFGSVVSSKLIAHHYILILDIHYSFAIYNRMSGVSFLISSESDYLCRRSMKEFVKIVWRNTKLSKWPTSCWGGANRNQWQICLTWQYLQQNLQI